MKAHSHEQLVSAQLEWLAENLFHGTWPVWFTMRCSSLHCVCPPPTGQTSRQKPRPHKWYLTFALLEPFWDDKPEPMEALIPGMFVGCVNNDSCKSNLSGHQENGCTTVVRRPTIYMGQQTRNTRLELHDGLFCISHFLMQLPLMLWILLMLGCVLKDVLACPYVWRGKIACPQMLSRKESQNGAQTAPQTSKKFFEMHETVRTLKRACSRARLRTRLQTHLRQVLRRSLRTLLARGLRKGNCERN